MRSVRTSTAVASLFLLASALSAGAASFTFDFANPDGTGSSFGDAISLETVDAITDDLGNAIGFTKFNGSQEDTTLELTTAGLEFDVPELNPRGSFSLGIPFDTTGTAKITARFAADLPRGGFSQGEWGIAFGDSDDRKVNDEDNNSVNGLLAGRLISGSQSFSGRSGDNGGNTATGASVSLNGGSDTWLSIEKRSGAPSADFTLGAPSGTSNGSDSNGTNLNDPNAFGYLWVFPWLEGDDWDAVTVTSMTFEGSNLVVPTIVPEPTSLALLCLAGAVLVRARRR